MSTVESKAGQRLCGAPGLAKRGEDCEHCDADSDEGAAEREHALPRVVGQELAVKTKEHDEDDQRGEQEETGVHGVVDEPLGMRGNDGREAYRDELREDNVGPGERYENDCEVDRELAE